MKKELPTIDQLKSGVIDLSPLQKLLETEPPIEWLKDLEVTQNKVKQVIKYLPIERVDYLLRSIYTDNWCEILSTGIHNNSCQVTLRLFVVGIDGKISHVDGIGGASSLAGVDVAVALAKSNAKKNASKELGKIFGRDLSRELESKPKEKSENDSENKIQENEIFNHVQNGILKGLKTLKVQRGLSNSINFFKEAIRKKEVKENDKEISEWMVKRLKDTTQNSETAEKIKVSILNFIEIAKFGFIEIDNIEVVQLMKAKCLKYGIEFNLDNI